MENKIAQVVLVKDINPGASSTGFASSSNPNNFTEFNEQLFFTANDGENGNELWVSDGTTNSTQLLIDINSGTSYGSADGSYAASFTEFNEQLFFSANDGENGNELWVSDGTTEGTELLVDINPGNSDYGYANNSDAYNFTEFNEQLFFTANDGVNGNELWVSDGTTEGTELLVDINPGSSDYGYANGSSVFNFTEFNEQLFFTANDGVNGNELWVSDGTTEGTQLLVDINPGSSDYGYINGSYAYNFTEFNEQLFFTADDGVNGSELWVSDGTTEGTQLLLDINPDSSYGFADGSYASNFIEVGGKLFFTANDGENGNELWVSDGTTEGTQLLVDINPSSSDYGFADGSYASNFIEFGGKLFFTANDGENGDELWISDGTTDGTQLLLDINPGSDDYGGDSSFAFNFTEFGGKLFFTANDGENGNELWVSDGTTEGTQLLLDINPGSSYGFAYGSYAFDFTEFDGQLFFSADDGENGNELWVSDGTTDGTQLVLDIDPDISGFTSVNGSYADNLVEFDGQLFFSANDGENGDEFWVSDGTTEGTQLLVDINPGSSNYGSVYGSSASGFTEFDDQLFFSANDGENGNELWISDGTAEGTQLLVDINSGSSYSFAYGSYASGFTEFNDQLFFSANDGENGNELWVSDGTAEGTQLLLDINPGSSDYGFIYGSYASGFTEFDDQLFFSANDGENGNELWVSDGTAEGTQLLVDINSGSSYDGSYASGFTEFNDQLFFSANDGENGNELWVSDGTTEGTQLLVDINPGSSDYALFDDTYFSTYGSYASNFIEFNDQLFFTADDGINGNELWVSDGTTEGTQLLLDINPGNSDYGFANSSSPSNFIEFDDQLLFTANDGVNGNEIWVSDGTVEGTQLLLDINPGDSNYGFANSSYASDFTVVDDELFFGADNGEIGTELFKLTFDDSDANIYAIASDNSGDIITDFT